MLWSLVVPIKQLSLAKTRLRSATKTNPDHESLVLAFAHDTITAGLACEAVNNVIVVTTDLTIHQHCEKFATSKLAVIQDSPARGLNSAIEHGAAVAANRSPQHGVAVLPADLPALRPMELAAALAAASAVDRGFVADSAKTGTTLLACQPGTSLQPRFGDFSRDEHLLSGAAELDGDWPSLRLDIDTPDDLIAAAELGLGPATTQLLSTMASWRKIKSASVKADHCSK